MPIVPLGQRLLIRPDKTPAELRGLVIPEHARDRQRPESGQIVAVSPDMNGEFRVGTRVCFAPYSGVELLIDGEPCVVLGKGEILGVLVDAAAS